MRVYLLASFPSLHLHAPAPLGLEEVLTRCADQLRPADFQELDAVCSTPPEGKSPFARDWSAAWTAIRAFNDRKRLEKLTDSETAPRPAPEPDSRLRADLETAWEETDPLRRETALLEAEWNWLETRRRAAPYELEDLLGYALQLRLLERRDSWEESAGATQFQEHVRSFLEPALEQLENQELTA